MDAIFSLVVEPTDFATRIEQIEYLIARKQRFSLIFCSPLDSRLLGLLLLHVFAQIPGKGFRIMFFWPDCSEIYFKIQLGSDEQRTPV